MHKVSLLDQPRQPPGNRGEITLIHSMVKQITIIKMIKKFPPLMKLE